MLFDVTGDSGEVHRVVELPNTPEMVVLSSDNKPIEEESKEGLDEDLKEDPKMGVPKVEHGVRDVESVVSGDDTGSSFDSGEEPRDKFNSDYNPFRDCEGCLVSNL